MAAIILDAVKVSTTVNIGGDILDGQGNIIGTYTLTTKNWNLGNESIDGVSDLSVGDRVLVKSQTNKQENGIYVFASVLVNGDSKIRLVRSTDFASGASITPNTTVFIQQGTRFGDTGWTIANDTVVLVGTSEITFKRFTVNENLIGVDLPSNIVLRSEKGFPLTNDELDGNFRYLSNSLVQKFNTADFTGPNITEQINAMTAQNANLNAWKLRGYEPSLAPNEDAMTIALRDENGVVTSTAFSGDLIDGVADNATNAVYSQYAVDVTGIVAVAHGGTAATTAEQARNNLSVVGRAGDRMTGTLVLGAANPAVTVPPTQKFAPLKIELGVPTVPENSDIWAAPLTNNQGSIIDYQLYYRYNDTTKTIAALESPNFTGVPTTPNLDKTTNSTNIVNAKFVQDHVADLNAAINLKAPKESPTFTGTPIAPTAEVTVETQQVATTKYVADKVTNRLASYDTSTQVTNKLTTLKNELDPKITTAQQTADEALMQAGIPVGTVMHFAANRIPAGWLKCNGELVSTTVYNKLFSVIGYLYGGSGSQFRLPDLRGEFLRGFDDSRGVDQNRAFGSSQQDQIERHKHVGGYAETFDGIFGKTNESGFQGSGRTDYDNELYYTNDGSDYGTSVVNAAGVIGNETRPRNVAMMPCIKAFGIVDTEDQIDFAAALNEINTRVRKSGDSMSGALTLSGNPTQSLHAVPKQYVDTAISNISLTPGPKGDTGATGATGPKGDPGSSYVFTYGIKEVDAYTNIIWYFNDTYNHADVFPPAGKTMSDLIGFIPSIRTIYFAGGVNRDDAMRCEYSIMSDRIRVWVQNTEQRWKGTFNWLAVWRA